MDEHGMLYGIATKFRCLQVEKLLQTVQIPIDKNGRWQGHPQFVPTNAFFAVEFSSYRNEEPGLRSNLTSLYRQLMDLLPQLNGLRYYDVLQQLTYRNLSVMDGLGGYASIRPNIGMDYAIRTIITDWSQARDMSKWVGRKLTPAEEALASSGRWPNTCDADTYVVGYGRLKLYGRRAVTVLDTMFSNPTVDYYWYRYNNVTGVCEWMDLSDDYAPFNLPVLGVLGRDLGRQDFLTIEWDLSQVLVLEFCNKHRAICLANFGVSTPVQALDQRMFVREGSTENLPTAYDASNDMFGFLWTNKLHLPDGNTFFVVPQFLPDMACSVCDAANPPQVDCQSFVGVELHYFDMGPTGTWQPVPVSTASELYRGASASGNNGNNNSNTTTTKPTTTRPLNLLRSGDASYLSTYEYNMRLSSGFNEAQAYPSIECDVSELYFAITEEQFRQQVEVPFQLVSGVYSCQIEICNSFLERIANAFANVELAYVIAVNLILFYIWAKFLFLPYWREHIEPHIHLHAAGNSNPATASQQGVATSV
eukprot:jgi/Mesvir1/5505/Mv15547-RA.2